MIKFVPSPTEDVVVATLMWCARCGPSERIFTDEPCRRCGHELVPLPPPSKASRILNGVGNTLGGIILLILIVLGVGSVVALWWWNVEYWHGPL